jgi:phosphatidylglycerophosphate synthase
MLDGLRARTAAVQAAAAIALLILTIWIGGSYPVICGACFAAIALVVIARVDRTTHPFHVFGAANQVTTIRAALVSLLVGVISEPRDALAAAGAVGIGLVITLMDGLDGWLARRTHRASRFGARFDMEVDALLILVLSILVWQYRKAGAWVVLSGLLRYGFLAAGLMFAKMRRPLPDSRRRQTICVVQISGLLIALSPWVDPPASDIVSAAALLALVYSFAVDTRWLLRTSG